MGIEYVYDEDVINNELESINSMDKSTADLYQIIVGEGSDRDPLLPTCKYGCSTGIQMENEDCPTCHTAITTPTLAAKYCVTAESLRFIELDTYSRIMPELGEVNKLTLLESFLGRRRSISKELISLVTEFEEYQDIRLLAKDGNTLKLQPGVANYQVFMLFYEFMYRKHNNLSKEDELLEDIFVDRYVIPSAVTISNLGGKKKPDTIRDINNIIALAPRSKLVLRNTVKWTGKVVEAFFSLYRKISDDMLSDKTGVFRQSLGGQVTTNSFRATILNLYTLHYYDEVHVPFVQIILALETQVRVQLKRMGLTNDIIDEQLRELKPTKELIQVCKLIEKSKITITPLRNPAQGYYAVFAATITKINYENYKDYAVYISPLVYVFPNGDIDGDQLTFTVATTERIANHMSETHPSLACIANGDEPFTQFGKAGVPKHVSLQLSNAINLEMKGKVSDDALDEVMKHKEAFGRNYREHIDNEYRYFQFGEKGRENMYNFSNMPPKVKEMYDEAYRVPHPYSVKNVRDNYDKL